MNQKSVAENSARHKNHNGITLIALVITIIVMLILVSVTISMAVNGGLFGYAGQAAKETKNAIDYENTLANVETGLSTDALIAQFTVPGPSTFTIHETEYQYEPGMTWEDWCNSQYNVDGYYCYVWQYPSKLTVDGVISSDGGILWNVSEDCPALRTDITDSEKEYDLMWY